MSSEAFMPRYFRLSGSKRQRLSGYRRVVGDRGTSSTTEQTPGPLDGDPEVDVLLELWALGMIAATVLVQVAKAACLVAPRPQAETLSALGHRGANPGS